MTHPSFDGSLRDLLRDTAQTVSLLSQGGPVETGAQLRRDALRQVQAMDAALTERGLEDAIRRELVFAQCGLLDEVALKHLSAADRQIWETAPLQVERFGYHDAGDRVFANLDAWLRRPDADVHLLQFYAAIIALGFQGRYARDGDDARARMLEDLGHRIAATTTSIPTRFITYDGCRPARWRRLSPWVAASVMLLAAGATYIACRLTLDARFAQWFPPAP